MDEANSVVNWQTAEGKILSLANDERALILQLDGEQFSLLLQMGGKGGWDVTAEGTLDECKAAWGRAVTTTKNPVGEFTTLDPPERRRTYHFGSDKIVIENVTAICVRPSGTHRLETSDGKKWIVDGTWDAIELDVPAWTF